MIHCLQNWIGQDPSDIVNDGDVLIDCRMIQEFPDTDVLVGKTGLVIISGNYINCNLPADTEVDEIYKPNTAQIEFAEGAFDSIRKG